MSPSQMKSDDGCSEVLLVSEKGFKPNADRLLNTVFILTL